MVIFGLYRAFFSKNCHFWPNGVKMVKTGHFWAKFMSIVIFSGFWTILENYIFIIFFSVFPLIRGQNGHFWPFWGLFLKNGHFWPNGVKMVEAGVFWAIFMLQVIFSGFWTKLEKKKNDFKRYFANFSKMAFFGPKNDF